MTPTSDITTTSRIDATSIGSMYTYVYDPKWKTVLPYYDTYPLVFVIGLYSNGFLGINLHYLPPRLRAELMDALHDIRSNDRYDATTKLQVSYQVLNTASKYRYFKPCVKRYLWSHVVSAYVLIPPDEWDLAVVIPTQKFQKATENTVWDASEAMVRS
jgi:hypothetical protein